eukprot:CAMPEP_0119062346 /NCGR_PEP_ID=MMETSP1178-20130426/5940_1 /TAXON_ID=33656 /ORGANISM="unid sp, Strain CCMP2000" /LENGTH=152 /DNA_ID=CAMNT_0007043617 /DNA_START=28 /DNA_END=486 /DNA_ORIENTATION=-
MPLARTLVFDLLFVLLGLAHGFTPSRTFATFGNEAAKQLIRSWAPHTTSIATGVVLINNPENMRRFVRARILLESPNTGCIASFDDSLSVVICRFSRSEHQLLLPLWPGDVDPAKTLANLRRWHREQFADGARLSGKHIESPEDQAAWNEAA